MYYTRVAVLRVLTYALENVPPVSDLQWTSSPNYRIRQPDRPPGTQWPSTLHLSGPGGRVARSLALTLPHGMAG